MCLNISHMKESPEKSSWIRRVGLEKRWHLPIEISRKEGVNIIKELESQKSPFIEIAGPTDDGFWFFDFDEAKEPEMINLATIKGVKVSNVRFEKNTDFLADAKELPIKDNSLGAVFCAHLGTAYENLRGKTIFDLKIRKKALLEASRVLQSEGYALWQGLQSDEIEFARKNGLMPIQLERFPDGICNVIFKKQ